MTFHVLYEIDHDRFLRVPLKGTTPEERKLEAIGIFIDHLTDGGCSFDDVNAALEEKSIQVVDETVEATYESTDPEFRKCYLKLQDDMHQRCKESEERVEYQKYLWLKDRFESKMTATEHDALLERAFLKPSREQFIFASTNPIYTALKAAGVDNLPEITRVITDVLRKENESRTIFLDRRAALEAAKRVRTEPAGVVYQAVIGYLEELEHKRVYTGNGHHLAQKVAEMAVEGLRQRDLLPPKAP